MMTDEEPGPLLIGARNDLLDVLGCILQYSLYYLLDISKRIQSSNQQRADDIITMTWTTPTPALDWMEAAWSPVDSGTGHALQYTCCAPAVGHRTQT